MIHRISRKKYQIFSFDIESHNDEESIAKKETSMWLGCFIDETSQEEDESIYFYNMNDYLDRLEELTSRTRKKTQGKNEKRPVKNICTYIYNLSFEWSFILPVLIERGFKYKAVIEKDDEKVYNTISTKSVSSVWMINLKFNKNSGLCIFRDLAKIYGGGLGNVAKAFNLPTQKGEIDYRLNRLHNHIVTKEEKHYIFRDVKIIMDILEIENSRDDKDFWNSCSMASYSMRRLMKSAFPRSMKPYQEFRKIYPELDEEETNFLRESVGGGLTYATEQWQYVEVSQDVFHIDKHQMHPTQMYSKPFPCGYGTYFKGKPKQLFKRINCCHIRVSYDDALLHSCIKLLNNNHMVEGAEIYVWDFEIPTMRKIYTNLEIEWIDGYSYEAKFTPFRNYVKKNYLDRLVAKANKDEFNTLFYKLLNNSSYGKFLEKPHNEQFENIINELGIIDSKITEKDEKKINAKYTYLPVGSCIPAYSRVDLIETALKFCPMQSNGYPDVRNILYFDTDSIFGLWNDYTKEVWKTIPQKDFLCNWGWEELLKKAQFTAPKRYKTEDDKGKPTFKAGGINFLDYKAKKIDDLIKEQEIEVDYDERKQMIEDYTIPYNEVNIVSSSWRVQRAYRVKGGTIIEFQDKEISIPKKYLSIYERNKLKL